MARQVYTTSLRKNLATVEEAKRLLGYPLLGSIPQVSEKAKVRKTTVS